MRYRATNPTVKGVSAARSDSQEAVGTALATTRGMCATIIHRQRDHAAFPSRAERLWSRPERGIKRIHLWALAHPRTRGTQGSGVYRARDAEHTVLHRVIGEHLEAFLREAAEAGWASPSSSSASSGSS